MTSNQFALMSRRVLTENSSSPIPAIIIIQDEQIQDILPITSLNSLPPNLKIEDLGSLLIFPGLIDLNVSFLCDSSTFVTKQAASGGTTLVCTLDHPQGELYTDLVPVLPLTDLTDPGPGQFAYKAYLVPQGPNSQVLRNTEKILEIADCPLIVHPELAEAEKMILSTPFRQVEPERRGIPCKIIINEERNILASEFKLESDEEITEEDGELENSDSCSEDYGPEIVINGFDGGDIVEKNDLVPVFNSMSLSVPNVDRKRVSLPTLSNTDVPRHSPRHRSFQVLGLNSRPVPLQDIPFINKGIQVEQAYHDHILKFPDDWEIAAVNKILNQNPGCPVHFSNVCSSQAIRVINQGKKSQKVTIETSLPYIYFSESDVKPGDTRYKLNPPIRDHINYKNLWQMIKNKEIDCVSSYHQPVAPPNKFIGDFTRAVNGVTSAGFLLQCVWTKLRTQVSMEDEAAYLGLVADLLCRNPAKVLNIENRGGIGIGKLADFVIWDPDSRIKISKTYDKFPEMSPLIGEEVYGVVHRTYLRGNLVFSNGEFAAKGQVLKKHSLN